MSGPVARHQEDSHWVVVKEIWFLLRRDLRLDPPLLLEMKTSWFASHEM
jgi:hypothetical protein